MRPRIKEKKKCFAICSWTEHTSLNSKSIQVVSSYISVLSELIFSCSKFNLLCHFLSPSMCLSEFLRSQTDEEKDGGLGPVTPSACDGRQQISHAGTTEAWNLQPVVNEPSDFVLCLFIAPQIQSQRLRCIWRILSPSASRWLVGWSFWPLARSD